MDKTFTYTVITTRNDAPFATFKAGSDLMAAQDYMEVIVDHLHNRNGFTVALIATCADPRLSYTKRPGHSGF